MYDGGECGTVGSVGRWGVWDGRECATVGRWGVWDGREWGTVGSVGQWGVGDGGEWGTEWMMPSLISYVLIFTHTHTRVAGGAVAATGS